MQKYVGKWGGWEYRFLDSPAVFKEILSLKVNTEKMELG